YAATIAIGRAAMTKAGDSLRSGEPENLRSCFGKQGSESVFVPRAVAPPGILVDSAWGRQSPCASLPDILEAGHFWHRSGCSFPERCLLVELQSLQHEQCRRRRFLQSSRF